MTISRVWVSYPLKQGLKLSYNNSISHFVHVWVSYPLKQGLKPTTTAVTTSVPICLSQLSIKTRIETKSMLRYYLKYIGVWVSYPLKQGLKLKIPSYLCRSLTVWVSYPLKQGLKRQNLDNFVEHQYVWVSYPLKQGLKLISPAQTALIVLRFESAIH